ncbi:hypothetical protein SAMN04487859_1026 [Roseovarius lutimaris]|uniref:Uncharacterized protein n=1 Tax=Roseovarius lutimaris TaxID=1005928 RepID=A0A1I4YR65_9RHOB|nr:hypothetical protein [Roseovarius lutimaris]SFN40514.1 hypothetical protein SAMN04487859_1026 [Roseovarius lutimaris]
MNRFLALFAFAVFAGFLYILASKIGEIDLWIVTLLTAGLAAYDFVTSSKDNS